MRPLIRRPLVSISPNSSPNNTTATGAPGPGGTIPAAHAPLVLKPETLQRIDEVITHYPVKRSATLPLLHLIQEDVGWISPEAIEWIAAKLELQPINVYEVVTFYPMFRQRPIGRRHVKVCRTLSCALVGAYKVCGEFEREFHCHRGEISPDGEVTIDFVECLASCGTAPVVMVDDDLHEKVDAAKVKEIANQIRAKQQPKP
jgi:NADH-quinone oxidoreductase subunit E